MKIEKDYIQERGKKQFVKGHGFLFAEFTMGTGKTKLAIDIARMVQEKITKRPMRGLHICHSVDSRDTNTPLEYEKWNATDLLTSKRMQLIQYEGLDNFTGQIFDYVVFDEVHYITERHYKFFKRNKVRSVLLLTGTRPDDSDKMKMIRDLCKDNIIVFGLMESVKYRTVNDFKIRVMRVDMTEAELVQYNKLDTNLREAMKKVAEKGDWILTNAINARMWFIYKSDSKLRALTYIRNQLRAKNRRFLMFVSTQDQANKMSPYRFYSEKKKNGPREKDFENFKSKAIDELVAVNKIKEGANIEDLLYAVAMQIKSKTHSLRQMLGRLLRGKEGDIGIFYIIVLMNTKDEDWVNNALSGIPKEKISYHDLSRELLAKVEINQ